MSDTSVGDLWDTVKNPDSSLKETHELRKETVTVNRVVDGDTVVVEFEDGMTERVRLLLIDTPESVHPTKEQQPFGVEASNYVKELLSQGKKVIIEIGNPERDNHNRLLAYIWVDGKNLNQLMIEMGYARVAYVYPPNTKYLDDFQKAEEKAREQKIGIWSIPEYVTDKGFTTPKE